MNVLQVIHGYPMRYNAGSEIYTQTLSRALANRHQVHVFTREENAFAADYTLRHEVDSGDERVELHVVNVPRHRDRYRHVGVDRRFAELLEQLEPDVVHIGHLNHVSTSLVAEAARRLIPVVYTLHDYWLMCPRGQFMQMHPEDPDDLWPACVGHESERCAERCYARYFSGAPDERARDREHWTDWVARRMAHVREMTELVDLFVAPSRYLLDRYRRDFGLPPAKLVYVDYGFDLERLRGRRREPGEPFTFGYIGTHIPAKGIHVLLRAFGQMAGRPRLRIWGRARGQDTEALRAMATSLPGDAGERIEWRGEYPNEDIVPEVLNRVDAIVVASVWVENSPLVIHEAQQARVPVITADAGGMAEYVQHEVNGLLFEHRSPTSLAQQMTRLVEDPGLAARLGQRGYLFSESGDVPDIAGHVREIERLYDRVQVRRDTAKVRHGSGPWRITFDTNPDTCNLHCIMCEERSPYRPRTAERPPRVMPWERLRSVVEDAVPHGLREVIPSTMGEPLLYEHLPDLVDLCGHHGLTLNVTTNGTFPGRSAVEWAELLVPVTSDIKISWNGASKPTQEAIMGGACWERQIEHVRDFISVRDAHAAAGGSRCRVTFQVTFIESNVGQLADLVRLAASLGVDRVKGHHVWTHFPELEELSLRRGPASVERWNLAVAAARVAAREHRLSGGREVLLENLNPLGESATADIAPGGPCPFLGQEAWVSAEGRFDPCCAPDALRRGLGDFGNVRDASLMKMWHSDAYRHLVRTYRTRSLCLGCNMRRPLDGS